MSSAFANILTTTPRHPDTQRGPVLSDPKQLSCKYRQTHAHPPPRPSPGQDLSLGDLSQVSVLGAGGFGKVTLVQAKGGGGGGYYALKQARGPYRERGCAGLLAPALPLGGGREWPADGRGKHARAGAAGGGQLGGVGGLPGCARVGGRALMPDGGKLTALLEKLLLGGISSPLPPPPP